MEVMLEIYRTLKTLKMEWKAKPRDGDGDEEGGEEGRKERERERSDESEKQRRRREEEERVKKAQELYFVETRCRMDDVMVSSSLTRVSDLRSDADNLHSQVRMDLQLYRIDDQNYLVDFRNLGYRPIRPEGALSNLSSAASSSLPTPLTAPNSHEPSPMVTPSLHPQESIFSSSYTGSLPQSPPPPSNTADELRSRRPDLLGHRRAGDSSAGGGSQLQPTKKRGAATEVSSPYLFLECAVRLIVELASPAGGSDAPPA